MNTATLFGKLAVEEPELIVRADKLVTELGEFSSNLSLMVLELERGYDLLALSAKVGMTRFRRLLKKLFPYTYGDILNFMSVAQLHARFPNLRDKILTLGASACKELMSASDELVDKVLNTTATTLAEIKKIIKREKKGLALAPEPEYVEKLSNGAVVEVTKKKLKITGWLAEVVEQPDEFGRLTVRLIKTCKTRQFFVDEVRLYDRYCDLGANPDDRIAAEGWELLRIQYNLNDNNFESVKELAYTHAQQSASPEDTKIDVLWKHAFKAIDNYEHLIPVISRADMTSSSNSEVEEKTYTYKEVQAEMERAFEEYKRQIESEWNVKLAEVKQLKEELNKATVEIESLRTENDLLKPSSKNGKASIEESVIETKVATSDLTVTEVAVEVAVESARSETVTEPSTIVSVDVETAVEQHKDKNRSANEDGNNSDDVLVLLSKSVRQIDFSQSVLQVAEQMAASVSIS